MTTLVYQIPAIHCHHCQMTIEREVGELEGVQAVSVSVDARQATIEYAPPASPPAIESFLAEIGYPIEKPIQLA
jgi:copper chaperone CopZ